MQLIAITADTPTICYLCGLQIHEGMSRDHVPPKQFFAEALRKMHNLNLLRLPTHFSCNRSYQLDEEYFIHTFSPLAIRAYSGRALLKEVVSQYRNGRNVPLNQKVLKEFIKRPSGLVLPSGKLVKRFDPKRMWRTVWKVTRGLFFHEYGRVLPEDTPRLFKIVNIGEAPPAEFRLLINKEERGAYPGIFAYKYMTLQTIRDFHFWAMLFWDSIMVLIYFHDPACQCETCKS